MLNNPQEFAAFWAAYPRREAKLDALKAYAQARKIASAADILAGVERYKRVMPEEKRYRPLPASWLRAGRWLDEVDDEPATWTAPSFDDAWHRECQQLHGGSCGGSLKHRNVMLLKRESA